MSPSERYYAFTDPVTPMALLLVAELTTTLPVEQVGRVWAEHFARHAPLRMQAHADLTLSEAPATAVAEYDGRECPRSEWNAELAALCGTPFGHDRPALCRYLSSPAEGRSRLVLAYHHSVTDGRNSATDMQALLRRLDGQPVPDVLTAPSPAPEHRGHPWQSDRREYLAMLRSLKQRQDAAGELTPRSWSHAAHDPAAARFQSLLLEPELVSAMAARAKAAGARVFGALGAGWLTAVQRALYGQDGEITLQLASPVDLRAPADVAAGAAPEIGVIANRFRVGTVPFWQLAAQVQAATVAAGVAGEGQLFLDLAGASRITELDVGVATSARLLAAAPPTVSATNLGVLDPGADPDWVESLCGYLTTTPNHLVFVSGAGYRGRIAQSIASNDRQVPPAAAAGIVAAFGAVIGEAVATR